jgi:hypothetical protein
MPVIKVWCLPDAGEAKLNELHKSIVRAVVDVSELGVRDEKDITCLFPSDMMKYGLGTEIIVEVSGLYEKPERTAEVRQRLAQGLVDAVKEQFPDTEVIKCFVNPFNPSQGFAQWRKDQ